MINKLGWDSDFFGYNIGRLDVYGQPFDEILFKENSLNFHLVYIFSDMELNTTNAIQLVDIKTVFEKKVNIKLIENDTIVEFDKQYHSYLELEQLAYLSGTYSRFRIDENFKNDEFKKLYKIWLDKSLDFSIAFKVYVKIVDGKIAGFVTLKKNSEKTSQIGLISVCDSFQGKGIASELIQKTEFISSQNGFENFQVPTQFENKAALKLYTKNGFEIIEKKYIYHYWNI